MVYRNMERRVRRVEAEAIRRAPGSVGAGIRASIQRGPGGEFRGVIRSSHPASIYLVNGTRPHQIRPRNPNGVLRFTVGGQVVYAKLVNHPGTRRNDYLRDALRFAL
jgi:hypothetical protein